MAEDTNNNNTTTTITQLANGTEIGGRSDWGNKLVVNTGTNPVINFAFMLRVEGIFDLPCKSIKGIRRENEFDHIQEGGLNDYVHLKRKPITKPFTFQVERYVGVNWIDPMPLGTELTLPVILFVNKYGFPGLDPVRTYAFTGCTVISKDYGELNAEASGLLVETVTIAYREMVCIDIPSETLEEDTWKFKGKEKEGQGPRNYNSNLYNKEWERDYNSKAKMMERAEENRWKPEKDTDGGLKSKYGNTYEKYVTDFNAEIDKKIENATDEKEKEALKAMKRSINGGTSRKYEHSGTAKKYSSAKYNAQEATKTAMEAKAEENRWKPEKETDGSLKSKYGNTYENYVSDHNAAIDKEIEAATTPEEKAAAEGKKIAAGSSVSRKYEHSGTAKKYSSAKYNAKEATKTAMEAAAESKRWTGASGKTNKYGNTYERYVSDHNAAIDKEVEAATTPEEKAAAEGKKIAAGSSASRKYEHSGTAKKYSSAKYDAKEATKTAMEATAESKRWTGASGKTNKYGNTYERYVSDHNAAIDKEIEAATTPEEKAAAEGKKIAAGSSASRKYEHSGTAKKYSSAKYHKEEPSKEAMEKNAKKWSPDSDSKEKSARPEPRLWPETSSANTKKMEDPKARLWPEKSSATTDKMEKSKAKLWPNQSSASREQMKTPEPRLWPKTRSARQITDFLKNH